MTELSGEVVSVHAGSNDDLSKEARSSIQVELDGIVGDRHRGYARNCWSGDKQPEGSVRRNERQWSAVSIEELEEISTDMGLLQTMTASSLGANLCIRGIAGLSRLPKGSLLKFPSGAELIVEEYNPPCKDMGEIQASLHGLTSVTAFPKAARLKRGIVGVVEAGGVINAGDEVTIVIYETPSWLVSSTN